MLLKLIILTFGPVVKTETKKDTVFFTKYIEWKVPVGQMELSDSGKL